MRYVQSLMAITLLGVNALAHAVGVLSVIPNQTSLTISSRGTAYVNYTVTNNATIPLRNISISQNFGTGATISKSASTCDGITLHPSASCTFQLYIEGLPTQVNAAPILLVLSPQVCTAGTNCATSVGEYRVAVSIDQVSSSQPIQAYVAVINGLTSEILPIDGTSVGTPITGFNFFVPPFRAVEEELFMNGLCAAGNRTGVPTSRYVGTAISLDGQTLYVTDTQAITLGSGVGSTGRLNKVNVAAKPPYIESSVVVGTNPSAVVLNPNTGTLYVSNGNGSISVVNGNAVTNTIPAPPFLKPRTTTGYANFLALNPAGTLLFVSNLASNLIYVYDTTNLAAPPVFLSDCAVTPKNMVVSPDNRTLYVSNGSDIAVYHATAPYDFQGNISVGTVNGLTISPDGSTLYAAITGVAPAVAVINTSCAFSPSCNTPISLPSTNPFALALDPSGTLLYVTSYAPTGTLPTGVVTVIDLSNGSISTLTVPSAQFNLGAFVG